MCVCVIASVCMYAHSCVQCMHACMHTHLWRHPLVDAAHDGGQEACLQIRRWHEPLPGYKALKVFADRALHQGGGPTASQAGRPLPLITEARLGSCGEF